MSVRRLAPLVGVALLVAVLASSAPGESPVPRASAYVVQVTIPGQDSAGSGSVVAPPNATDGAGGFALPADGTLVRVASGTSAAVAQAGTSASAQATATALGISLFGGEITADSVDLRATSAAGVANATADTSAATVTSLVVLGQQVSSSANLQLPVADWGSLDVLSSTSSTTDGDRRAAHAAVVALRLRLLADHDGLPAGSEIVIGSVQADAAATVAVAAPRQPTPSTPPPTDVLPSQPSSHGTASTPTAPVAPFPKGGRVPTPSVGLDPGKSIAGHPADLVRAAPDVTARLTSGGYVFPVFGPASFGDTFGAPRADVPGGWHHGEDIFAPLGTPLLAVANGTVFSVGWNAIGGWRLWLRDDDGNEFYYAHLSAYSPLAVDGHRVKAGDVLGFMGNTGDARASAVHLHFEIHPRELLPLGYDGCVAPYPFLIAWRRAEDVSFAAGRSYVPLVAGAGLPRGSAPPTGAVLLEAHDISHASGLVPGALGRVLDGANADETRLVPRGS